MEKITTIRPDVKDPLVSEKDRTAFIVGLAFVLALVGFGVLVWST